MGKIKWSETVTNKVLGRIGEKRTLLNNILLRRANWINHILRRNCLLHYAIRTDDRSEMNRKSTAP